MICIAINLMWKLWNIWTYKTQNIVERRLITSNDKNSQAFCKIVRIWNRNNASYEDIHKLFEKKYSGFYLESVKMASNLKTIWYRYMVLSGNQITLCILLTVQRGILLSAIKHTSCPDVVHIADLPFAKSVRHKYITSVVFTTAIVPGYGKSPNDERGHVSERGRESYKMRLYHLMCSILETLGNSGDQL